MLELAVLGLLKEKPMSGYELQKLLTAKLGAFWRVSFGSLYPCLKRLSAQGALAVIDSPSMSRKKHVYRLTERGELLFQDLLESADVHDLEQDRFPLRLAFFRYLQPETRIDQLERRRGYLQHRLRDLRASLRAARDRMDAYTLSLMDHGLEEREREIAWLDRLIAAERGMGSVDQDLIRTTESIQGVAETGREPDGEEYQGPGADTPVTNTPATARRGRAAGTGTPRRARAAKDPKDPDAAGARRTRRTERPASRRRSAAAPASPEPDRAAGPDDTEPAPQAPATSDHDLSTPTGAIARTRRISG